MIRSNDGGDVLFVNVEGSIGREELNRMVTVVEQALERHAAVHMLVEVDGFAGVDLAQLGGYLPRALAMLRQRQKFGRIAVVANQGWVRWASRVESTLLPGIRYEVYEPAEREQALAWVTGQSTFARASAIRLIGSDRPDVLAFELDGAPGADEVEAVVAKVAALLETHPKVSVLATIHRLDLATFPAYLSRDYIAMKWRAFHQVERYALVGGPPWLTSWVSALAPSLPWSVRCFDAAEEAEAWKWLGAVRR